MNEYDDDYVENDDGRYYDDEDYYKENSSNRPVSYQADDTGCQVCGKRVYEQEKITADQIVYHKACFKCSHCKRLLNLSNFCSRRGIVYCKPHFIELFNIKGGTKEDGQTNEADHDTVSAADEDVYSEVAKLSLPEVKNMKSLFESQNSQNSSYSGQENNHARTNDRHSNGNQQPIRVSDTNTQPMGSGGGKNQPMGNGGGKNQPITSGGGKAQPIGSADRNHYVEESESQEEETGQEEMPPAAITRNLVARFQSMSDTSGEAHQGFRGVEVRRAQTSAQAAPNGHPQPSKSEGSRRISDSHRNGEEEAMRNDKNNSTNSNVNNNYKQSAQPMENRGRNTHNSPANPNTSHRISSNHEEEYGDSAFTDQYEEQKVVREDDPPNEIEFPEEGLTRSLVAHWREAESSGAGVPLPKPIKHNSVSSSVSRPCMLGQSAPRHSGGEGEDYFDGEEENLRNSGVNEEEFLPPENIARGLVERFREMETNEQYEHNSAHNKNFKWDVKEVKPVNYLNQ